jgi:uncharacterized protein (DUF2141 family)
MKRISFIIVLILIYACASVTMPTGGPPDEDPPELISSNPVNNQKNFSGHDLEFVFNEDIRLNNAKEEILITPSVGKDTRFVARKRKVIIQPELPWQPNTTYNISFRDGVQDLTEGNPAENLRLAFSTGPIIDSLTLKGKLSFALTEKIPEKITVAIYQNDTFDIFRHQPIYFTKSTKEKFSIENLKPGRYFLYAFDDKNKNLRVDRNERFGFKTQPIELPLHKDSVELALVNVDARPIKVTAVRHTDLGTRIRFNKLLESLKVSGVSPSQSLYSYGENSSELIFYHQFNTRDSLPARIIARDSVGNTFDTLINIKYSNIKTALSGFTFKEIYSSVDISVRTFTHQFQYTVPVKAINPDSIYIRYDSLTIVNIPMQAIRIDTLKNQLLLITTIKLPEDQAKKTSHPKMFYGKGAFISIQSDSSRAMTKEIKIPEESDLGSVLIKVETKSPHFEIQLLDTKYAIVRSIRNVKEYTFKNLEPQEYKIRVHIDSNNNNRWDVGNFNQHIEPEKMFYYISEEGKYSFPLRANWEYGPVLIKF